MTGRRLLTLVGAVLGGVFLARAALARRRSEAAAPEVLPPDAVRRLYDRLAPFYNTLAAGYRLVGAGAFRRRTVEALGLRPGDVAVDLACGTGVNFPYLVEAVGTTGRVVGVDLSPGMLKEARNRVEHNGWTNVELVEADMRNYAFPPSAHAVLSTFGLEMVPEYDDVVSRAVAALAPGGRIAVSGLRHPEKWPEWLIRLGELVNRPFGVNRAYENVQPWRSVEARAVNVRYEEYLVGAVYLAIGDAPPTSPLGSHRDA